MPSVFTIEGADGKRRRKKKATTGEYVLGADGNCKWVKNPRTGCKVLLCKTGRGKTGWTFKGGSSKCSR